MRFKHVLFSGLLLSTAFVACTNEDFETIGTPDYSKDAISLGENLVISGGLATDLYTKAIYEDETGAGSYNIKSKWEPNDSIGAAWYAAMTSPAQGQVAAQGFTFEGKRFASNHPFDRVDKEGYVETAEFQTVTNTFAGKYVLYYPYNSSVAQVATSIPVPMETAQTMKVSAPLAHVNETMFFYSLAEYEKGGNQAGNFEMDPVPVIYRLAFRADEATRGLVGQNISMVVIETANDKFYSQGQITVIPGSGYPSATAAYSGLSGEVTNVYTLTIEGNEGNADYQVSAVGEEGGMKKPFYLTMLPADESIEKLIIKAITDKGEVYKRELNLNESSLADIKAEITKEGGKFTYYVTLDEVEEGDNDAVYTEQQFNNAWEAALESGEAATITLGAPLKLDELTLNHVNSDITIDGNTLTVGTLAIEDGKLTVADLKATDVNVESYGEFVATKSEISGTLSVVGDATLNSNVAVQNVNVARAGILALTGGKVNGTFNSDLKSEVTLNTVILAGTSKMNGEVTTAGTVNFNGAITLDENAELTAGGTATNFNSTLNNKGTLTANAAVNLNGTTTNDGTFGGSATVTIGERGIFTNNGTIGQITNNGTLKLAVAATSRITNGGTLEVTVADKESAPANLDIENNKTVNFNLSSKDDQVTMSYLKNNAGATVNINRGKVFDAGTTAITGDGVINIAADGALNISSSFTYNGYIIVETANATAFNGTEGELGATKVACYYSKMSSASGAAWVIINNPLTIDSDVADVLKNKSLLIKSDITLAANMEMASGTNITVEGEISLSKPSTDADGSYTLNATSGAETFLITKGSLLKVYTGIELNTTNFTNEYYNDNSSYGNAVGMGGTVQKG